MIRIGQRFKDTRIKKGFSLEDVSQSTKIRTSFLSAIENGEYEKLPSVAYATGFVRNYARFLGLSEKASLALFRREFDEDKAYRVLPHGFAKNKEFSIKRVKIQQTAILAALVFLGILGYILFQYRQAIINPPLTVSSPLENAVINSSGLVVLGKTDPDTTVFVDNYPVSVESDGSFRKTITVFPGKTTITIKAVNKFGRQTILKRDIEAKPGS